MKYLARIFTTLLALLATHGALAQDNLPTAASRSAPPPPGSLARQAENEERSRKASQIRWDAEKAIRKGEFARAVPLLRQVLELEPDDTRCMEYLADIYIAWKRPAETVQALDPIYHPPTQMRSSDFGVERIRMKYVLALLDTGKREEAITTYNEMPKQESGKLQWQIPAYTFFPDLQAHTLPHLPVNPDEPSLRAQAHLILGSRPPRGVGADTDEHKNLEYMLDHLRQALKSDRRSLDAHFLSGVILGQLERFAEARAEFAQTAKLASREAKPEIKAALDNMNRYEASKKLYDATHPANADAPSSAIGVKATSSTTSDHSNEQGVQNGRAF